MKKKDTLFILGAGVSVDHKYPTGTQLLEDIINVLDEKISIFDLENEFTCPNKTFLCFLLCYDFLNEYKIESGTRFNVHGHLDYIQKKINEYDIYLARFHKKLKYSYPRSIDDFIQSQTTTGDANTNNINKKIGKLLIVLILTCYEEKSLKYDQSSEDLYQVTTTFFTDFWKNIYGSNFNDFIENINKTQFITFNYDRLLEHFIYSTATSFFDTTPDQNEIIKEFLSNNILHVYGALPKMEWQSDNGFPYGSIQLKELKTYIEKELNIGSSGSEKNKKTNYIINALKETNKDLSHQYSQIQKSLEFILEASKLIKTYSEEIDNHLINGIKEPKKLYFLGFSFHELNLEKLNNILKWSTYNLVPHIEGCFFGMKYNEFLEAQSNVGKRILPKNDRELNKDTFISYNSANFDELSKYKIPDLFRSHTSFRYLT